MIKDLKDLFFESPWHSFFFTFISFTGLYFLFSFSTYYTSKHLHAKYRLHTEGYKKAQLSQEIQLSIVSILVFSLQSIFIQKGYSVGLLEIDWNINLFTLSPQVFVLFIWNEIHFYISHRLLHARWFFRHIHKVHHYSYHPSPFSIYSFHWAEAFLLGTVIFLPLVIYPFQFLALLSLPLVSIFLNTLGHWNYDLFPHLKPASLLKFSYRHSMHHQKVKGNFGFSLPYFDKLFNTDLRQ
jgi:sterol desaturase/sphingolipid hydroxylase (fatty acid hydroxylase superfamily)